MKALFLNIILLIVAVSATAQIRPVESLPIAVNYSKTIHLIFPSAVKYSQAVTDFVAVAKTGKVPPYSPTITDIPQTYHQTTPNAAAHRGIFFFFHFSFYYTS